MCSGSLKLWIVNLRKPTQAYNRDIGTSVMRFLVIWGFLGNPEIIDDKTSHTEWNGETRNSMPFDFDLQGRK